MITAFGLKQKYDFSSKLLRVINIFL